jgi:hypothetical protein
LSFALELMQMGECAQEAILGCVFGVVLIPGDA